MAVVPFAFVLCTVLTGSLLGNAAPDATSDSSTGSPGSTPAPATTPTVTRISPMPRGAVMWTKSGLKPMSLRRSGAWIGGPDGNEHADCGPRASSAATPIARRIRDYVMAIDSEKSGTDTSSSQDSEFDFRASNHRPFFHDFGLYGDYETLLSTKRRQPFPPPDSDHDGSLSAPGSGELVLDDGFAGDIHKHDGYNQKPSGDGRSPVMVRGPGFNAVAIGFLVYLVLLSVLQNSIFNISRNGLLGLGLGPLRDRERRDMPAQRRVAFEQRDPRQPVLVAAVLDSEQHALGGPRRARRTAVRNHTVSDNT